LIEVQTPANPRESTTRADEFQQRTHNRVTLPPTQVKINIEPAQSDDELNRGQVELLHPAENAHNKKMCELPVGACWQRGRTEPIIETHENCVLSRFQRLFLSHHPMRQVNKIKA
jgi:hypothetical protein